MPTQQQIESHAIRQAIQIGDLKAEIERLTNALVTQTRAAQNEIERLRAALKEAHEQLWHLAKNPKDNALLKQIREILNEQ